VLPEDLIASIRRTLERKRLLDLLDIQRRPPSEMADREPFRRIVTASPKLLKVMREAELHASSDVPVLITGESGTGKELLARAIHAASPRSGHRFTAVNMASLSAGLFDAEFFGHMKGAFTGAERDRSGYLEHTHRGTLFLDEIGNLPPELQGKLLRFLQSGEYMKLGTNRLQQSDVRLIAATNEDLDRMMAKGAFRKDLYYRIRGGWLRLPPLRERPEDIPILVNSFLAEYGHPSGPEGIDERALSLLLAYEFPGNVRELKAIIASAVNLARGRPVSATLLPEALRKRKAAPPRPCGSEAGEPLPLAEVERAHILRVYALSGENKAKAARLLGVGLNTLRRKLGSYGVS
jgi:transcriptional regulator with PAS, ATPase and Fis domain